MQVPFKLRLTDQGQPDSLAGEQRTVLSGRTPRHGEFTAGRLLHEPTRVIATGFRMG